ncbi:MAG: hypothetical protein ACYDDO_06955 [Acidiferrobacterales bacterium]
MPGTEPPHTLDRQPVATGGAIWIRLIWLWSRYEAFFSILYNAFYILFGAICFGLALAFGLGGQKWAAGALERFMQERGKKK